MIKSLCLVCSFSAKRHAKDQREMDKQILRAEAVIANPSKLKRTKFVKSDKSKLSLNQPLRNKSLLLLGVKGYYTNLGLSDEKVIERYHDLWHVEQAFRVSKSDLKMRPIFHFKENAIKVHLIICFMALMTSKFLELKTNKSIKYILKKLTHITDANLLNTITGEKITLRMKIDDETQGILEKAGLWY